MVVTFVVRWNAVPENSSINGIQPKRTSCSSNIKHKESLMIKDAFMFKTISLEGIQNNWERNVHL